jgi:excisionase family DNA binding protein
MSTQEPREILNIDEAALLLGVSIKTFNKVLHSQNLPARKIGREWKFSRSALIAWVGSGNSAAFYRDGQGAALEDGPAAESRAPESSAQGAAKSRRTAGWRIEFD